MDINGLSNTVQRRKKIIEMIGERGEVFIPELSKIFVVSEVTIRNDLKRLEEKRILLRARGGAIRLENFDRFDQAFTEKARSGYREKLRIGVKAASLINESDKILIDSGTTTFELVKNLTEKEGLTVITNSLKIAGFFLGNSKINLIIPGGTLLPHTPVLIGPMAEYNLRNFHVDKVFIGVDGIDTQMGVYATNFDQAHLTRVMIEISSEVILLTDSSKFYQKSLALICHIDQINTVITDEGIPGEDYKRLEDAGIKVIIA